MTRALALAAVLATGCLGGNHPLAVTVRSAGGQTVPGATVACVCDPTGEAGAVTGPTGVARLVVFHAEPERCVITVVREGFQTAQQRRNPASFAPLTMTLEPVAP